MKTLTLRQPWATLMAQEHKTFETRSWKTSHRGLLAIHAGKKIERDFGRTEPCATLLHNDGYKKFHMLPRGFVIAIVNLQHIYRTEQLRDTIDNNNLHFGNWKDGRFAWQTKLIYRPTFPIPATGKQGLWNWNPPLDVRQALYGVKPLDDLPEASEFVQRKGEPEVTIIRIKKNKRIPTKVGWVRGNVWMKIIDGRKHFLQIPHKLCFDTSSIEDAQRLKAEYVVVLDKNSQQVYGQRIDTLWLEGWPEDREHNKQWGLPLDGWRTRKHEQRQLELQY